MGQGTPNQTKAARLLVVDDEDRNRRLLVESTSGAAITDSMAASGTPFPIVDLATTERAIPGEAA